MVMKDLYMFHNSIVMILSGCNMQVRITNIRFTNPCKKVDYLLE